jgi:hypothetical protein
MLYKISIVKIQKDIELLVLVEGIECLKILFRDGFVYLSVEFILPKGKLINLYESFYLLLRDYME